MEEITTFTLQRIAAALEEQNRFNWQWLEKSTAWHEENKENGERITAIHEENAARDQAHRERLESMAEGADHLYQRVDAGVLRSIPLKSQ